MSGFLGGFLFVCLFGFICGVFWGDKFPVIQLVSSTTIYRMNFRVGQ